MRPFFIAFSCLLFSCSSVGEQTGPIHLLPLSVRSNEFITGGSAKLKARNDYFFTSAVVNVDSTSANRILKAVQSHTTPAHKFPVFSIYIYRRTDKLNASLRGSVADIRGVYDNDLIAYLRWTNGEPDIFYLLHDGDVVYDGLAREAVATPFEFD